MELDKFDLNILSCLDLNARQSYAEIGKKIRRSKQFVEYRIRRLSEERIIEGYSLDIDLRKMGYTIFNIFLQFHRLGDNNLREIIKFFNVSSQVGFCLETLGNWDLFISVKSEGISDFYKFVGTFHSKFSKYIKRESINLEVNGISTNLKFLNREKKCTDYISVNTMVIEKRNFSKFENNLIFILRSNPMMSYLELSTKLKKSHETIRKTIKSLEREKILKRTRAIISLDKLGYERYLFLIELHFLADKQKEELLNYLKYQENIDYTMECIGSWNIICNTYSKNIQELRDLIIGLKNKFNYISSIEFLRVIQTEKEVFSI